MAKSNLPILVQKYGGSSVKDPDRLRAVATRILSVSKKGTQVVVVVSAMGDTTDDLVALVRAVSKTPNDREYDQVVSTGENISAALLVMAIHALGGDAISLTGIQAGIQTDGVYGKARITGCNPDRIHRELQAGKIVVVTGFQGGTATGDVVTIGRGGSDTSAVVLAAVLGARACEIYTDVDGIYTTDPRLVKSARLLPQIAYDEMLEMASLGAKVLHPRSVEVAKSHGVKLIVRSSYSDAPGTVVKESLSMEIDQPVTGVTLTTDAAKVSIVGMPDRPGVAHIIFSALADAAINVDMIIQSTEENQRNTITFTVDHDDLSKTKAISEGVANQISARGVITNDAIAKVSIVGVGMISKPGVAARMFDALGKAGINIQLITTSEIKISCAIEAKFGQKAVEILHAEFGLDHP